MALRYFIKYFDTVDIEHRFNIYDDAYVGDAEQIGGKVILTYSETDDPLEAIRGQGLSVELEADTSLTFNDLWSEEEKTFQCEYKRDDVILFNGWLNPEGFFENWVSTNWIVTFDCVDGLGYLKDLAFVEDATGLPITGRKTYIELLSLALVRTGLYNRINTSIDIRYTGLGDTLDVLENVYANTERYIKDDGETIMSCDEVIRDILEPFGAVLTSLGGEWYIYKPNQLYANSEATFYKYTYLGAAIGLPYEPPTKVIETSIFIGSNWKGATLHHCSGNQQIRNKASIGAYRIYFKYGEAIPYWKNTSLGTSSGSIDDFDYDPTRFDLPSDGSFGVYIKELLTGGGKCFWSLPVNVGLGDTVSTTIKIQSIVEHSQIAIVIKYYDTSASVYWYLNDDGDNLSWQRDSFDSIFMQSTNGEFQELNYIAPPITLDLGGTTAEFQVDVFNASDTNNLVERTQAWFISEIKSVSVGNQTQIQPEGKQFDFQRTNKPSSKIKDIKEVATGDDNRGIFLGTIYKNDTTTPTETWNRKGVVESKPILQIMGEETMRMSQLPAKVFSGDVFGYFNYLSTVNIDGVDGIFEPVKYSYDTKANIISSEFRQMYADELIDILPKQSLDYGNTVKPTIIG